MGSQVSLPDHQRQAGEEGSAVPPSDVNVTTTTTTQAETTPTMATISSANDKEDDDNDDESDDYGNFVVPGDDEHLDKEEEVRIEDKRQRNDAETLNENNTFYKNDAYSNDDNEMTIVSCIPRKFKSDNSLLNSNKRSSNGNSNSNKSSRKFSLAFHSCTTLNNYDEKTCENKNIQSNDNNDGSLFLLHTEHRLNHKLPSFLTTPTVSFLKELEYTNEEMLMEGGDELSTSYQCDLRPAIGINKVKCRTFHIVTTAALPWMTGTAVNPLLRAAYLNQMNRRAIEEQKQEGEKEHMKSFVTLCLPWLVDEEDRKIIYGDKVSFTTCQKQENYIRKWLDSSAKLPLESSLETHGIQIIFYKAKYSPEQQSIYPVEEIQDVIHHQSDIRDVCILEEPEHLNFSLPNACTPWTESFNYVVGIMHTNYQMYLSQAHLQGLVFAPLVAYYCSIATRIHCDKIIKLSETLQTYAGEKECVNNVHGIRSDFLEEGHRRAVAAAAPLSGATSMIYQNSMKKVYFIGKLIWAKGFDKLLVLENHFKKVTGEYFDIDIVGSGQDKEEIQRAFLGRRSKYQQNQFQTQSSHGSLNKIINEIPKSRHEFRKDSIPASFPGRMDHAMLREDYNIFVNPSVTEVLCTTTAEALAMGKFVIIPQHPSNTFFEQFPNCLVYKRKEEFVSQLQFALSNDPTPLSQEQSYTLTWESATVRFVDASKITQREECRRIRLGQKQTDKRALETFKSMLFHKYRAYNFNSLGLPTTISHIDVQDSIEKREQSKSLLIG